MATGRYDTLTSHQISPLSWSSMIGVWSSSERSWISLGEALWIVEYVLRHRVSMPTMSTTYKYTTCYQHPYLREEIY